MIDWTVREFRAFAAGRARDQQNAMQLALWQAWHTAQLSRAKRIPPLERLVRKMSRRRVVRKTPAQLLETAKMITTLMQHSGRGK